MAKKFILLRFCRTLTKLYVITSQTRVKRVSRIHHRSILKRVWPTMHLHTRCLDRPQGPSFRGQFIRSNSRKLLAHTSTTSIYMLSVSDFEPKGTISEVRVHSGAKFGHTGCRLRRSPNVVRDHAGTAQVDF